MNDLRAEVLEIQGKPKLKPKKKSIIRRSVSSRRKPISSLRRVERTAGTRTSTPKAAGEALAKLHTPRKRKVEGTTTPDPVAPVFGTGSEKLQEGKFPLKQMASPEQDLKAFKKRRRGWFKSLRNKG